MNSNAAVNVPLAMLEPLVSKRFDAFARAIPAGGAAMEQAGRRLVKAVGRFLGQPVTAADVYVDDVTVAEWLKRDGPKRDQNGRFAHTDSRGAGHESKPPKRSGEHAETHTAWDNHESKVADRHRAADAKRNDARCDRAHQRYEQRLRENPAAARAYGEPPLSAGFKAKVTEAAAQVASKCASVVKKADRIVGRLMPAFEAIMDCPSDMVKFGYEPTMHGNAFQSIDPIRHQLGISAHLAASLLTKAICMGLKLARKKKGDGDEQGGTFTAEEIAAAVKAIRAVWFHAAVGLGVDAAAARKTVPPAEAIAAFIHNQLDAK